MNSSINKTIEKSHIIHKSNTIQAINSNTTILANRATWLDNVAVEQLVQCASFPHMHQVVGMPDLHPGRTYPIGAAFLTQEYLYPALIGNDIGCGMAIWQTDLLAHKFHLSKTIERLSELESPLTISDIMELCQEDDTAREWLQELEKAAINLNGLGTIGRGNHFVELQKIAEIYRQDLMMQYGLSKHHIQILVHSGSRGLGESILNQHLYHFGHIGLSTQEEAAQLYLQAHDSAMIFAKLNRLIIAKRFARRLRTELTPILDRFHNFVEYSSDCKGFIHRKGASPSNQGIVVIPGSRGDFSYIVEPNANSELLHSIAHGAGRKWQRSHCKANLKKLYHFNQLFKTKLGSHVICQDRNLIYEEAPEAYKPIIPIIDSLVDAGMIEVIAKLKPLITFKTEGECC